MIVNNLFFNNTFDDDVLEFIKNEQKYAGHYCLPEQSTDYLKKYAKDITNKQKNLKHIVVVGIGGSSLGAQAIYEFLKNVSNFDKELYFLDSTNPVDINSVCSKLDFHKTHFIIISKSGTTIEVIALYKHLLAEVNSNNISHQAFSFITDKGSQLASYAKSIAAICIEIDTNISGRFSVLSAVGLFPLMLVGADIDKVLVGAKEIKNSFFNNGYIRDTLLKKAHYYAKHSMSININAVFSYSQSLHFFNHWFVQLWGESLGKKQQNSSVNVGLTPIGLIGPKDQHSFLQLLAEGKRDKSVSFIKLKSNNGKDIVPDISLEYLDNLDVLNNISFAKLLNMQADATIESLKNYGDIPIDVIELSAQDESNIGGLIYYFELLTSLVGKLLNVNTYNQPGVENTKIILINKLKSLHKYE